jgi:hypothetical protein
MSDSDDTALPPEGEPISYPIDGDEPMSLEDAARDLAAARNKALNPTAERAKEATAETELPPEGDADPAEEPPIGEDEEADPEAEKLPPIERPKSWTETEDAEWRATPRALQEKIVARELERDTAIRRAQNEAAEKLKGLTAKEQQAEQVRQQYEAKLPALMQALHNTNNTAFSDIKSQDDADLLAIVDPARWVQWKAHQDRMAATHHELQQAEQGKSVKQQQEWKEFRDREDALATEKIPDLADPEKADKLMKRAGARLAELGFKPDELNGAVAGKEKFSLLDHRMQMLIFDSLKLADIQAASKKTVAAVKPLPPVQRPGTTRPANSGSVANIQALEKQLETATGNRAAEISARLYALEKKSAAR